MTYLIHFDDRFLMYVSGGKNKHQKPNVKKIGCWVLSVICVHDPAVYSLGFSSLGLFRVFP